ncbi:epidermal growth factor-like protein [Stomoxys calcitrans]|uniref:epidermal growth factor-like protein n=1 Tax=Stomoxys calcitrans TaxID=35570 RepID=UPI0027E25BA2|nr:epidermal growth factor-like protein [Stomoxys calcitrans]
MSKIFAKIQLSLFVLTIFLQQSYTYRYDEKNEFLDEIAAMEDHEEYWKNVNISEFYKTIEDAGMSNSVSREERYKRQVKLALLHDVCEENGTKIIYVPTSSINKFPWIEQITQDPSQLVTVLRVCCPGQDVFVLNNNRSCVPFCKKCRNGVCVSPDKCECYDGFVKNDNGDCVFQCPIGCLNGRCHLYKGCICNWGFQLDSARQYCRPKCNSKCKTEPLRNCTKPGVCGCIRGFSLIGGQCRPSCSPGCGPGGECQAFGVESKCVCFPGYSLQDGVCKNDCFQGCNNGICQNRNKCICNPGFIYDPTSRNCINPKKAYEKKQKRIG